MRILATGLMFWRLKKCTIIEGCYFSANPAKLRLCWVPRQPQQFPKWKLFYTKNSKGIYSVVIPKITPEMALQIDKIGGSDDFEIFNSHYRAFTKIINMLIINKSSAPMKPILEMYSQASEYFESCLMENSWNHELTSDYVDGMTWVFTECCPEGFSFDGERYVEDG